MSGKASFSGLTVFQFEDGNLWQDEHSIWCAFTLWGKSEYFFGLAGAAGVDRFRRGVAEGCGRSANAPVVGVRVRYASPNTKPPRQQVTTNRVTVRRLERKSLI